MRLVSLAEDGNVLLKLRAIWYGVDFRMNEQTNLKAFEKHSWYPGPLRANECFLFVSRSEDQLLWIFKTIEREGSTKNAKPRQIIDSRRWRITGGMWNPQLLADYADEIGITLSGAGFKKYKDAYNEKRAAKSYLPEDNQGEPLKKVVAA